MDINSTDGRDPLQMWTEWQSESIARRRVDEVYKYVSPTTAPASAVCCVLHPGEIGVHRHHLDESGEKCSVGWFFENLVPICGDENSFIDETRKRREGVEAHEALSAEALGSLSGKHHKRGQLLFAYACARLGAFLYSPLRLSRSDRSLKSRPSLEDASKTIQFATQSLYSLRGVPPRYGIPLATDTLRRSTLTHLNLREFRPRLAELVFSLVVAVGAFHRDYGDVLPAFRCVTIASRLATSADLGWKDPKYAEFMNHVRILYSGLSLNGASDRLAKRLSSETKYADNLHGKLNLLQWSQRQLSRNEAEQFLAKVQELEREYLESGSFASRRFTLKTGLKLSAWDHFAIITRIGEAYEVLGDINRSDEIMRASSEVGIDGAFGVNRLGRLPVYDKLAQRHPGDKAFSFSLLKPHLLQHACKRSASEHRASNFSALSRTLLTKVENWYSSRKRIVLTDLGAVDS